MGEWWACSDAFNFGSLANQTEVAGFIEGSICVDAMARRQWMLDLRPSEAPCVQNPSSSSLSLRVDGLFSLFLH